MTPERRMGCPKGATFREDTNKKESLRPNARLRRSAASRAVPIEEWPVATTMSDCRFARSFLRPEEPQVQYSPDRDEKDAKDYESKPHPLPLILSTLPIDLFQTL